jgi:hypothetical protein
VVVSEAAESDVQPTPTGHDREAFSPRTVLALILVGIVAAAGFGVLLAYAPELRGASDPGAHALSSSAVGYRGAVVMLKAMDVPAVISRTQPRGQRLAPFVVLTPGLGADPPDIAPFLAGQRVLIVLPKWFVREQALHPGYVQKVGVFANGANATRLLAALAPRTEIWLRKGVSRPQLRAGEVVFADGTYLPLGPIDRLATLAGDGWRAALVDEQGRAVLAQSKRHPNVFVLVEPDLLNNQGVANLDTARAGLAILDALRGDQGVTFDVTLNGFIRGHGVGRTLLEPPWLAFTLAGVATAVLMGLHALARFGPVRRRERAFALGKRALVDNSAGLVRMAGREAELAPAYATLTKALIARRAGGAARAGAAEETDRWLADIARLRGADPPERLSAEAARAKSRDDLIAVGRRLYSWRLEMTRERR